MYKTCLLRYFIHACFYFLETCKIVSVTCFASFFRFAVLGAY